MSTILCDYHTHTYLCKHAEGKPQEYVERAKKLGIKSLGFSDHCPVPDGYDPINRMYVHEYELYKNMINEVQKNAEGIEILYGMEIDYVPGRMNELEKFISEEKIDYLIGSIHFVDNLPFDHPDHIESWNYEEAIERVWRRYFELMHEFVEWGRFDIIGHIDLPKKYSMRPKCSNRVHEGLEDTFKLAAEKGIMMELNTAGLRKPVKEVYPSEEILKIAFNNNVKIVFGSDAHTPEEVGTGFRKAADLAMKVGYQNYSIIRKNKKIETAKF